MDAVQRDALYREEIYQPRCVRLEDLITPEEIVELMLGVALMPFFLRGEFPCPAK